MRSLLKVFLVSILILLQVENIIVSSAAEDTIFEYYYIPDETDNSIEKPEKEFDQFLKTLPDEIKQNLPEDMIGGTIDDFAEGAKELSGFQYIWKSIFDHLSKAISPLFKTFFIITGVVILSTLFKSFRKYICKEGCGGITDSVINAGISLVIINSGLVSVTVLEEFTDIITQLMNCMIPFLTAIYGLSGNVGTASIQSGGIMMLVTLCNNLFTFILLPAVRICLVLSVVHSIFSDIGIKPITVAFRNITTAIMLFSTTLFSFMLGLQNKIVQSADTFGARSIKFFISNLIPIIGGAVSDSIGTIGGSLSVLKSAGGVAAIVIIIILLMPALITLLLHRFTLFLCRTVAEILGCTNEASLLEDMGSVSSIMIAFAAAVSIAFIYSLTLFTGSVLVIAS